MRIFVSYSSAQRDLCERLRLALQAGGRHDVFADPAERAPGAPSDETLRHGIASCDLFLFLISPDSVAAGSYARAELSMAQARWRHAAGHVLPVMAAATPSDDIPPYLRSVTILEPRIDVVAETLAAVAALQRRGRRRRSVPALACGIAAAVLLGAGIPLWERNRASDAETTLAITAARELCESGRHALAWQRFDEALARRPDAVRLRRAREDCAMRWLRDMRLVSGQAAFTDVVNRVLPVLADAAVSARGQRAADLRAHMGWAEYLRTRDGAASLDPAAHYRQALQAERTNVYAHAMWGHHVMVTRGPIADAVRHLSTALQGNRDRAFVRRVQLGAMLYYHEPPGQAEALRVANEMHAAGETIDPEMRERLWNDVYCDAFVNRQGLEAVRAALHDAGQPATFRWLYPQDAVQPDRALQWRFILASIEEASGEHRAARARFLALRDEFRRSGAAGAVVDETTAALQRLAPRP